MNLKRTISTLALSCLLSPVANAETPPLPTTKLYRLDCGTIHVSTLNAFSDTQAYTGKEKNLTNSCYLIQKEGIKLLWDTGLPDAVADNKDGVSSPPFTLTKTSKIADELAKIGLKPEDITHVGISHAHFDHTGTANLFTNAKLIIQKAEYALITERPDDAKAIHIDPANLSYFLSSDTQENLMIISGDTDIFGDGSVQAISLPGHTPGHMALLVNLPKSGAVILSGDQWHFNENHKNNGVPGFNHNRADTLASSDKLNTLVKNTGAKLVIQHETADIGKIPALPQALE